MKLGKVQKQWIADLRKYPERQITEVLGTYESSNESKLCCLGQLCITEHQVRKKAIPVNRYGTISTSFRDGDYLSYDYAKKLGLTDGAGTFVPYKNGNYRKCKVGSEVVEGLAHANDEGATWLEIADFIEKNPEKVFTKSV